MKFREPMDPNVKRMPLAALEVRCQKPDHRQIGNWMARRLVRPAALRVTWVVAPWGVTAHGATLAAWACGVAAAAALATGSLAGWLIGAVLLQCWYLLDHVDGQLARLRGTASLDGVQLDYLMHHTIHLLVPLGAGWGLFASSASSVWVLAGTVWALSLMLLTVHHDARYKAFNQRLKRVRGRLEVAGGGGARPAAQGPIPRGTWRLAAWTVRKSTEMHVVMNLLTGIAALTLFVGDRSLFAARVYVALAAPAALVIAIATIIRSQSAQSAEREFADWYQPATGKSLVFREGWWHVEDVALDELGGAGKAIACTLAPQISASSGTAAQSPPIGTDDPTGHRIGGGATHSP